VGIPDRAAWVRVSIPPLDAARRERLPTGGYVLAGDALRAVPLAREALTLARQIGDPALIASGLLAVGATVAETDPEQAHVAPAADEDAGDFAAIDELPHRAGVSPCESRQPSTESKSVPFGQ
jgi:hypothetical protein